MDNLSFRTLQCNQTVYAKNMARQKGENMHILLSWFIGLSLLGTAIGCVYMKKYKSRFYIITLIILTAFVFFAIGLMTFIGNPVSLSKLKTDTVYQVVGQHRDADNGFITTVKAPNGAFRLIKCKEQVPELFIVKHSFWDGKITIEEFMIKH